MFVRNYSEPQAPEHVTRYRSRGVTGNTGGSQPGPDVTVGAGGVPVFLFFFLIFSSRSETVRKKVKTLLRRLLPLIAAAVVVPPPQLCHLHLKAAAAIHRSVVLLDSVHFSTCRQKPWNLMIKHRQIHRRGRRSHMTVSYTDPQVSMDLLRAVLQPSFNQDIMSVFSKYQKFFEKAAENVKENVGDDVQTDQLIKEACRNVLEHAKQLFPEGEVKRAGPEVVMKRQRAADEDCIQRGSPLLKKRKMRPGPVASSDRPLTFSVAKPKSEPIKREGPKWDPSRLSDSSTFVLGSRANKALGMGGTRGRIYIKHADLFKYAADAKDKQWLAERHHMRATGGKMAYLLIEEDIQDLSRSDEYRDCPDVRMDELKPFTVPQWMVEKMQRAMKAQRDADL